VGELFYFLVTTDRGQLLISTQDHDRVDVARLATLEKLKGLGLVVEEIKNRKQEGGAPMVSIMDGSAYAGKEVWDMLGFGGEYESVKHYMELKAMVDG
jgi:hypothetical protein